MILADKIIDERKKNGWSQEELADRLGVSRQAVSKWESAQSVPDLQRILEMSKLFGVSTDYLLKDEEGVRIQEDYDELGRTGRMVSLEEANEYLSHNEVFSRKIAIGVPICVLCPVPLLLLLAAQKLGWLGISDNTVAALGVTLLFVFIASALALFIPAGIANSRYSWLEKESFDTAYGVNGMVRERSERFRSCFITKITVGVLLIIFGVTALVLATFLSNENDGVAVGMAGFLLIMIAVAVHLFVSAGIIQSGFQKLLQEGDFTRTRKEHSLMNLIAPVYWLTMTGIFLVWGFLFDGWSISWVIWPIAGVVFAIIAAIVNYTEEE